MLQISVPETKTSTFHCSNRPKTDPQMQRDYKLTPMCAELSWGLYSLIRSLGVTVWPGVAFIRSDAPAHTRSCTSVSAARCCAECKHDLGVSLASTLSQHIQMHKNTYLWCQSGFPGLIRLLDECSYTVRGIWDAVRPVTWAFWELILLTLLEGRNLQPTDWLLVRKHDKLLYINIILKSENNQKGPSAET